MKQKNYKWLLYLVCLILLGAILFLAFKDLTPLSQHIEKDITLTLS